MSTDKTIDWRKELDSDHIVSALFVDFSKAFDTIDHETPFGEAGCVLLSEG